MEILRLSDLALLASEDRYSLQATVDVAVQLLRVPVALVTVIDTANDRQVFVADRGLAEPYDKMHETPLDLSVCRHVLTVPDPLVIEDVLEDPRYKDHPGFAELGIRAYLGYPIYGPFDTPFAVLCVGDTVPRTWEERDMHIMSYLARQTTRYMQRKAQNILERDGISQLHVLID